MEVTEDDPAYVVKFKTAFKTDLASRQENTNNEWLKIATALDPRFKDLKSLPKSDRPEVWTTLERLLQEQSPRARSAPQAAEDGPPKKKMSLLVMGSDSESDEEVQQPHRGLHRYRAEPSIGMEDCPLEWWSSHSGAHEQLASLARKYLATPASTVLCETVLSRRTHCAKEAVSFTVRECEQVSLPHQLAKGRLARRAFRGIRLYHGVVNG